MPRKKSIFLQTIHKPFGLSFRNALVGTGRAISLVLCATDWKNSPFAL